MARAVTDFQKSEEFFALCQDFSQESFEGFRTRELECQAAILKHFPRTDLDFLNEGKEHKGKNIDATTEPLSTKLTTTDPAAPEPTPANPAFATESAPNASAVGVEPSATITDLKVGNWTSIIFTFFL